MATAGIVELTVEPTRDPAKPFRWRATWGRLNGLPLQCGYEQTEKDAKTSAEEFSRSVGMDILRDLGHVVKTAGPTG